MVNLIAVFAVGAHLRQLPSGWHKVELSASISVALPETAIPTEAKPADGFKLPPGEKLDHFEYINGKTSYVIGANTFTADEMKEITPDQVLANAVRGASHGLAASTIKRQRDITLNGWPGIEFMLSGDETSGQSRVYLIGRTMYQLLEVYPTAKGRPDGVDTFLGSFSLRPAPTRGPLAMPGPAFTTFAPTNSKCSISMPGKAELLLSPAADGSKAAFAQYLARYGNRVYMLGFVDMPKEPGDETTRLKIIGQMLLGFDGTQNEAPKTESRGSLTFDRVFFTLPDGGVGRGEIAIAAHRAYAVIMLYPPGHAGSPDIDTFFSSFKILEPEQKTK